MVNPVEAQMDFRILGPFEVVAADRPITPGARKPRALLAILLLHGNEVVSSERLIEELWSGRPPASAAKVLQTYVSQLRKLLPGDGRIVTRPPGYLIRLEDGELDLERFERLRAAGKPHEALALWRGAPLADFSYEPWAQAEIARLEEVRLSAVVERIEADLAHGRHGELVGELEALIRAEPLRERLRGLLMLALYRSGRQAEALALYRETRRVLVEELGIEPGTALQRLEQAILRQDPALELQPAPAPARALRPAAPALPEPSTPLVGREREVAEVAELLVHDGSRLVTLTGPGGTGKTRLALEVVTCAGDRFPDGGAFVDLAPVRDAALVAATIAAALDLREAPDRSAAEVLATHLAEKQLLLVLDNFEQVLEAAPLLSELLAAAPFVRLLVTSRSPLRLEEEQEFHVPPLTLPDAGAVLAIEELAATESVALFTERARTARPDFRLTDGNAAAVAELCRRLDGLPLALELAAARSALLSPRAMLARLGRRLELFRARGGPERHRTLRAAIEWSHDLLEPDERELFSALAAFVGGCTIDGAEALAGARATDVVELVDSLIGSSLLRPERTVAGEPRFGMLETIREYALERLEQREDAGEIRNRHARFFLGLAEEAEPELRGPRQATWLEWLDAEQDNLRTALAWSVEGGEPEVGLRIGAALWRFWQIRGRLGEGRRAVERLLALTDGSGPSAERAAAQGAAARLAFMQGDYTATRRFAEESLPVHRRLEDERGVAFDLVMLGEAAHAEGDAARSLLDEALASFRRAGDAWGESLSRVVLGQLMAHCGQYTDARRMLAEGLRGAREVGDARNVALTLGCLGGIALAQGDHDGARSRFEESVAIQRRLGDSWGVARSLATLALLAHETGDHAGARLLLEEAVSIQRETDDRPGMVVSLELFARLAAAQGRPARAARLFGAASVLREAVGVHPLLVAPEREEAVAGVRAALAEEPFAELWAEGRAMTLADVLSYSLEEEADLELARAPARRLESSPLRQ